MAFLAAPWPIAPGFRIPDPSDGTSHQARPVHIVGRMDAWLITDEELDVIAERARAYQALHVTLCPPGPLVDDLLLLVATLRAERAARRLRAA